MWLDLLLVSALWVGAVVGMLASQRKKPTHGSNREQATRNTNSTTK